MSRAEYQREYRKKHPEKMMTYEAKRRNNFDRKNYIKEYSMKYSKRQDVKLRVKNASRCYYQNNKKELIDWMGGKCVRCDLKPEDVQNCLGVFVIDEIEPLGIGRRKFTTLSLTRLSQAKQFYLEGKIQLLCQNCSAIKTWKNNDVIKGRNLSTYLSTQNS